MCSFWTLPVIIISNKSTRPRLVVLFSKHPRPRLELVSPALEGLPFTTCSQRDPVLLPGRRCSYKKEVFLIDHRTSYLAVAPTQCMAFVSSTGRMVLAEPRRSPLARYLLQFRGAWRVCGPCMILFSLVTAISCFRRSYNSCEGSVAASKGSYLSIDEP